MGRTVRLVAVLVAVAVVAGCSPRPSWAVRLTADGMPQLVETACEPRALSYVRIKALDVDEVVDEEDPVIWQITFPEPRKAVEITVGQLPEGAEEEVAWQRPAGGQELAVDFGGVDWIEAGEQFSLDELKDGKVMHHFKARTPEQFEEARERC
jgi:hypothetical protein